MTRFAANDYIKVNLSLIGLSFASRIFGLLLNFYHFKKSKKPICFLPKNMLIRDKSNISPDDFFLDEESRTS